MGCIIAGVDNSVVTDHYGDGDTTYSFGFNPVKQFAGAVLLLTRTRLLSIPVALTNKQCQQKLAASCDILKQHFVPIKEAIEQTHDKDKESLKSGLVLVISQTPILRTLFRNTL